MKQYIVMYYTVVCREYLIEAENSEEAITKVMEDSELEPDNEYTVQGGEYEAEERTPDYV